jgi:hypothetical protein
MGGHRVARTAARVEDLESGTLPPVCAKTGRLADGFATIEFISTPSWTWILLLFGIFPFLIAQFFSKVRVVGQVPMSARALQRAWWFTWSWRALFGLAVLAFVVAIAAKSSLAAQAGLVTLVTALLFTLIGWPFVWPTGRPSGEWVVMSFVNERFAREVDRRYGN